jgi:hypothetical protein
MKLLPIMKLLLIGAKLTSAFASPVSWSWYLNSWSDTYWRLELIRRAFFSVMPPMYQEILANVARDITLTPEEAARFTHLLSAQQLAGTTFW